MAAATGRRSFPDRDEAIPEALAQRLLPQWHRRIRVEAAGVAVENQRRRRSMTASGKISLRVLLAALALALAGCATNETAGEAIDDAALTARVKAAFVADNKVSALNIRVDSDRGEVHLSGVARDSDE